MNVMPRARDPNRDRAKEIWLDQGGEITNRQIAEQLKIDEKKVAVWKQRDKWNVVQQSGGNVVQQTEPNVVQQNRGAPKGNNNAVGNRGGAPPGNQNAKGNRGGLGGPFKNDHAVTHGLPQIPSRANAGDHEPKQFYCQASVFRRSLATRGYTPRANHPFDGWF